MTAVAFSMPPNRVADCRWASFSYGNGPTSDEKYRTISPATAKGPGSIARCSGAVYTNCGTHACPSAKPHAVWPSEYSASGAAAMTMRYTAIGCDSRHRVRTRPLGSVVRSTSTPFATTVRPAGAVIDQLTVALSLG